METKAEKFQYVQSAIEWLLIIYDRGGEVTATPADPSVPTSVLMFGFQPVLRALEARGLAGSTEGHISLTVEGRILAEQLKALDDAVACDMRESDD